MITYTENAKTGGETVKLAGKVVGEIRVIEGGYQYFPKGQKEGGAWFSNLSHCKRDIEGV